MSRSVVIAAVAVSVMCYAGTGFAADDTKVKSATRQVEDGAKTIGEGKVGTGVEETAKGVGNTVRRQAEGVGQGGRAAGQGRLVEPEGQRQLVRLEREELRDATVRKVS